LKFCDRRYLEDGETEGMLVHILQDDATIRAVDLDAFQHVEVSVGPVDSIQDLIDGNAVGPVEIVLHDGTAVCSVQTHPDNLKKIKK
jgi:hypothetical protein